VIDRTAIGMEALTVSPILSARYTLEAAKMSPSTTPRMMTPGVISLSSVLSGTYGRTSSSSAAAMPTSSSAGGTGGWCSGGGAVVAIGAWVEGGTRGKYGMRYVRASR
jgi:hypothetical protein